MSSAPDPIKICEPEKDEAIDEDDDVHELQIDIRKEVPTYILPKWEKTAVTDDRTRPASASVLQ